MKKKLYLSAVSMICICLFAFAGCEQGLTVGSDSNSGSGEGFSFSDLYSRIAALEEESTQLRKETTPAGSVTAFAGENVPDGWLLCDGQAVSREEYTGLFNAVGTMYGSGNGASTFNVPDYRGYFLRGWNNGAGSDPDAGTRTNRGDGTTGDRVGTIQDDNIKGHSHSYSAETETAGSHTHKWYVYGSLCYNLLDSVDRFYVSVNRAGTGRNTFSNSVGEVFKLRDNGSHEHEFSGDTDTEGGNETRAKNKSVMYIIKY
ncbi:MAG: tail fiber protein [bacterium]|nr:tail fiber protein [bacterium]